MPTVLRTIPEQSRIGTDPSVSPGQAGQPGLVQRTGWFPLTKFDYIRLQGQAAAAVRADPTNGILFLVLTSALGSDADPNIREIQRYEWKGRMVTPKSGGAAVPEAIDITFNLQDRDVGWSVALEARFYNPATNLDKAIVVGATLTGLP